MIFSCIQITIPQHPNYLVYGNRALFTKRIIKCRIWIFSIRNCILYGSFLPYPQSTCNIAYSNEWYQQKYMAPISYAIISLFRGGFISIYFPRKPSPSILWVHVYVYSVHMYSLRRDILILTHGNAAVRRVLFAVLLQPGQCRILFYIL